MRYYLSKMDRDRILSSMDQNQQAYLLEELKRGKRTIFANILARDKGERITPEMSLEEVEDLLYEWRLVDYIDAGPGYKNVKPPYLCQCGRVLRYQYVIQHQETKEIRKFGIVHFEEHTGFPPSVVKDIAHGLEQIDYELDEILVKYSKNWTLDLDFPEGFMIPEEYLKLIALRLPLLDRQIESLKVKIRAYKLSLRSVRKGTASKEQARMNPSWTQSSKRIEIDATFVNAITPYLKSATVRVSVLSKKLLKIYGYSENDETKKRELIVNLIIYMDGLCAKGYFVCTGKSPREAYYRRLK